MDRKQLQELIRQEAQAPVRQAGCPADDRLAVFMDGGLDKAAHDHLIRHLSDCQYCLDRVGMLGRARDDEAPVLVPQTLLARGQRLASAGQGPARHEAGRKPRISWAAAAVLVLAVALVARQVPEPAPPAGPPAVPDRGLRESRSIDPGIAGPRLLSPSEGSRLTAGGLEFNWAPVPDSLYYQVRILSSEGDLVWQERVAGTRWTPPAAFELVPGADYFVRIEAWLDDSRSVKSDFLPFRVEESRP